MGKRAKIDEAGRLLLVKECLAKRMLKSEAARRAGVSRSTIQKWISLFITERESGLQDRNKDQRSYNEEIEQKAVADYLSGAGSLLTVASRYNIRPEYLLLRWIRRIIAMEKSLKNKEKRLWQERDIRWRTVSKR